MDVQNASYGGMKVVLNPLLDAKPRFTLDPKVAGYLTPEFRKEMEDWCLSFFGTTDAETYVVTHPFTGQQSIVMGPGQWKRILLSQSHKA